MVLSEEEFIHNRNVLMIKILWGFIVTDLVMNWFIEGLPTVMGILLLSVIPLITISVLVAKRVNTKITMCLLSVSFLVVIFLLNLRGIDYINLIFVILPPIFSLLYRDWKNIIFNLAGSLFIFSYFALQEGHHYFVDWERTDLFYISIICAIFLAITMTESRLSENMRQQLMHELSEGRTLQKRLMTSEDRYRSMVQQSSEGIFVFNPINRQVIEANETFCNMLGYSEEELLKLTFTQFIVENSNNLIDENIDKVLRNQTLFISERQYKCKNGTIIEVEISSTAIETETETVVLVNVRDITEKRNRNSDLRMAKSVLDHILDGALVTDLKGIIKYVNPAFEKITGYSSAEVIGKTPSFLRSGQHDAEFYKELWSHVHTKGSWEGEIINRKKSGEFFVQGTQINVISNEHNEPFLYSSVFRDITEQKGLIHKLEESQYKFRSLFDNHQGISFVINLKGHITDVNDHACHLLGYEKHDLMGTTFIPLLNKEDLDRTLTAFEKIKTGEPYNGETKLVHKDGSLVEVNVIATPIVVGEEIVGVIGMAQNITVQKQSEKELAMSEERYRSLIKLYPEGIFVHSREGIEFINDKAVQLCGFVSYRDMLKKQLYEFLHPDDRPEAAYHLMMCFKGEETFPKTYEYRFQRSDGVFIDSEVSGTMIDFNGQPAILGIIRDISAQKETEQKLKEANDLLDQLMEFKAKQTVTQ